MQATTIAGALYRVNPLDQPGVELGKRLANAELGHPDYAAGAAEQGPPAPVARSRRLRVG